MTRIWNPSMKFRTSHSTMLMTSKHKQPFVPAQGKANTPRGEQSRTALKPKVFVGLSGGVDSSVSAALLTQTGYEVTGVFIKVWQPLDETSGEPLFECTWKDDRLDAMRVCAKLGIPFIELDLEKEYKKEVVDYMIREYRAGKTPNPDVFCNRFIKFGGFYNWARKNGADFIATGHYSRIEMRQTPKHKHQIPNKTQAPNSKLQTVNYSLLTGLDPAKDQSYFLWQIRKEQLPHILFPVGGMQKPEVRKLAKKFGLVTADKKDSQGLCFVGKIDMKEFLKHYIKEKPGKVLDEKGTIIGAHRGAFFYTLGERIAVFLPSSDEEGGGGGDEKSPYYVIAKDIKRNTLTVSHKGPSGILAQSETLVTITDYNWVSRAPIAGKTYLARVRYRQPLQKCHVANTYGRRYLLHFEERQTVAPGQSLVLYAKDICLGGGIIM